MVIIALFGAASALIRSRDEIYNRTVDVARIPDRRAMQEAPPDFVGD